MSSEAPFTRARMYVYRRGRGI